MESHCMSVYSLRTPSNASGRGYSQCYHVNLKNILFFNLILDSFSI
uniref:Uncharacterized protein n=1 Tax=Anguilla anguilla TaxID=7936 RepID=A0A0E9S5D6_ANGAN